LRVSFDPAIVKPAVVVEKDVDLALGPADVKLVTFSLLTPAKDARIRLVIEPV
jgi:hypothetical protein